jgi:predicted ATPase
MRVIGISGAQGAGKSSLLIELKNRGWGVDNFRVSRVVQAQLGWESLDNVMQSWETMTAFQGQVYKQKYNHDIVLWAKRSHEFETYDMARTDQRNDIILTERTFADIIAYTNLWTWRHVDRGNVQLPTAVQWLYEYTKDANIAQRQLYEATILLPYMDEVITWQDDPNRAKKADNDKVYEDVVRFIETKMTIDYPRFTITAKSVQDRADQVETYLKSL